MQGLRKVMARSKLPIFVLLYPSLAWLLSWLNRELADGPRPSGLGALAESVRTGRVRRGWSQCLWSAGYRNQPQKLPAAFRRGLYVAFALLWITLPVNHLRRLRLLWLRPCLNPVLGGNSGVN